MSVFEAKANFSALVARAEAGEEITISRHGRPAARLVPLATPPVVRAPGALSGRITIAPDFDDFTDDDARDWFGE